jgi:RND family efflux transporter MFP subunit
MNVFKNHGILSFLSLMIIVLSCGEEQPAEEILRPVRYQAIYASGGERTRTFSGVAQAGLRSRLSFKVNGTGQRIPVRVGDKVKPGQLIAELDPTDFQLQVEQARASLESARAQERNAKANYDRISQLYERRNASRNDLDAARASSESAIAQVSAADKQLDLARSQLSYTRLTAPVSGGIAMVDVEVNENVQSGHTIVELSSGSNLEVKVAIPGILISQIREGDKVEVSFDAISGKTFLARVTEVGLAATEFATTFPVTVLLDKAEEDLRPGMAAEVAFQFGDEGLKERIVVPSISVGEDREGRFVFVVEPSGEPDIGVVKRQSVTIGDFIDQGIEITEGLEDGELLVTAGVSKLTDGQKVKLSLGEGN